MPAINSIHKSPLRYPGGKNCIYTFVRNLIEENNMAGIKYAEPYSGGAGLALRLLMNGLVSEIHINDFDPSIYAFWNAVLCQTDDFCSWIEEVKIDIPTWEYYKQVQRESDQNNEMELAKSTFFLNRTNVSGIIFGGPIGGMKQTGKYKMSARFNKSELINRIQSIAALSNQIHLSNLDGLYFLDKIEQAHNDLFIYLDPPYYKKGSFLYMNAFCDDNHRDLSKRVVQLHNRWMVSYDNKDFILELYPQHRKIVYQLSQCTSNRVGDEVLIFDNRLVFENAKSQLKTPITL